jgi:biotin carboxyl carrier protein
VNAAVLVAGGLTALTLEQPAPPAAASPDRRAALQAAPDRDVPSPQPEPTQQPTPEATQPPQPPRTPARTGWAPYATVGPVVLHAPADVVELIGFHQSGHDGAQPQSPVEGAVRAGLLESRERDTHPQGAADVVVDPTGEVRAPVTGTVLRAGTYTLYCDHVDQYLVVEPDALPGWEVKLLHFEGLSVARGDRVEAGVTVVGSNARLLPFPSHDQMRFGRHSHLVHMSKSSGVEIFALRIKLLFLQKRQSQQRHGID